MTNTTGGFSNGTWLKKMFLFLCLAEKKSLPQVKTDEKYLEHGESSSPVGKLRAFLIKLAAG